MKPIYLIVIAFLSSISIACSQSKTPQQWLNENTSELKTETGFNFEALKKAIGTKRIVALGESTHGLGSFYDMKAHIVNYLHKEMGFEVLAMEGGLGDIYHVFKDIDTLNIAQLKGNSVFGNFRAKEIDTLFQYMKENASTERPLYYEGFDTQASSSYLHYILKGYIEPYDKILSDSIYIRTNSYQKSYAAGQHGDEDGFYYHRDRFINTCKKIKKILFENETEISEKHQVKEFDFKVIHRTLDMFITSVNLSFEDRYQSYGLRDQLMFENLDWLLTEIYPTKKFVIWAHNAHVDNTATNASNIKWMGHFLKEKYQEDYFSIGLFAYQGETYNFWTEKTVPFKNDGAHFIEKALVETGKEMCFLSLSNLEKDKNTQWIFEDVSAFEPENGGNISFIPKERFDAVISIKTGTIPTYK